MKKLGLLLLPILAATLLFAGNALAQNTYPGDYSYYFVTYYSNANTAGAADGILRIINDGDAEDYIEDVKSKVAIGDPYRDLWASIYVFDDSEELQECCNCLITADGLLSESVNKELTANELTGRAETSRGVIKVISTIYPDPTYNIWVPGLRGWMTHVQGTSVTLAVGNGQPSTKAPFFVTEDPLADSNLSSAEEVALESSCSYAITLGSGYGTCSCTPEDKDF